MKFKTGPAAIHFGNISLNHLNWYLDRFYNPASMIGAKIVLKRNAYDSSLLSVLLR